MNIVLRMVTVAALFLPVIANATMTVVESPSADPQAHRLAISTDAVVPPNTIPVIVVRVLQSPDSTVQGLAPIGKIDDRRCTAANCATLGLSSTAGYFYGAVFTGFPMSITLRAQEICRSSVNPPVGATASWPSFIPAPCDAAGNVLTSGHDRFTLRVSLVAVPDAISAPDSDVLAAAITLDEASPSIAPAVRCQYDLTRDANRDLASLYAGLSALLPGIHYDANALDNGHYGLTTEPTDPAIADALEGSLAAFSRNPNDANRAAASATLSSLKQLMAPQTQTFAGTDVYERILGALNALQDYVATCSN